MSDTTKLDRLKACQAILIRLKAQGADLKGQTVLGVCEDIATSDSEAASFALTLCGEPGFLPASQEEAQAYLAGRS